MDPFLYINLNHFFWIPCQYDYMRYFFHNFHVVIYNILLNNHFIKIQKREKRKTREKAKQLLQFPNGYCQIKMIGKILLIFYFFFHFFFVLVRAMIMFPLQIHVHSLLLFTWRTVSNFTCSLFFLEGHAKLDPLSVYAREYIHFSSNGITKTVSIEITFFFK
jgi:hypothetical protein